MDAVRAQGTEEKGALGVSHGVSTGQSGGGRRAPRTLSSGKDIISARTIGATTFSVACSTPSSVKTITVGVGFASAPAPKIFWMKVCPNAPHGSARGPP